MKCRHLIGGGQGADAAVLGGDPFACEQIAGFDDRPVGATVGDHADLVLPGSPSMIGGGSAARAVSSLRTSRSRFFFQSSGRSL